MTARERRLPHATGNASEQHSRLVERRKQPHALAGAVAWRVLRAAAGLHIGMLQQRRQLLAKCAAQHRRRGQRRSQRLKL